MTPPPDLAAARAAAERLYSWQLLKEDNFPLGCQHPYIGDMGVMEKADSKLLCRFATASIPADHDQPITEQWLQEEWGGCRMGGAGLL